MTAIVVDALAARFGGTAYAAIQTARRMAQTPLVVASRGSLVAEGLAGDVEVRVVPAAVGDSVPARVLWEAAFLPRLVSRRGARALLTWSGMLPRSPGVPVVSYLSNPVMFSESPGARARRAAVRRTARHAVAVAVPSEGMRALAEPVVGSVEVVPLGVDPQLFSPGTAAGTEILYVGDFYAHKRHDLVLDAWSRLAEPRPLLRFVGDPAPEPAAFARASAASAARHQLGTVEIEHGLRLPELIERYRAARVVVVASEAESFCMPALEAQACGVPVVLRDLETLHTSGGASATYVSGDDPADWAAAIARLFSDDAAHAAAAAAGRAHAAEFTWERTAASLSALLERAL